MEYKGVTVIAIILFALLFVGAIFLTQEPTAPPTKGDGGVRPDSLAKVSGSIPAARPNEQDADADPTFKELPSGLRYRILRKSDGAKPTLQKAVAVAYEGWLDDGMVFDKTYGGGKGYFSIDPPWRVIEGWKQGVPLVGEGGMIELEIPPSLGYGGKAAGRIPPNSTLHFKVEILKVFD